MYPNAREKLSKGKWTAGDERKSSMLQLFAQMAISREYSGSLRRELHGWSIRPTRGPYFFRNYFECRYGEPRPARKSFNVERTAGASCFFPGRCLKSKTIATCRRLINETIVWHVVTFRFTLLKSTSDVVSY